VPTATQVLELQQPLTQPLRQQGWPSSPQSVQTLFTQFTPGAVQWLKGGQQGWPLPPHVPHDPAAQIALLAQKQAVALAVHELMSQQPPPAHVPFAQHGWPVPPQATQVWALSHLRVEALHALPLVQHGWLTPPQVEQTPFEQARVAPEHVSPGQQT
jgi:hypothetical protein